MREFIKRIPWRPILVAVIGLGVAGGSFYLLTTQMDAPWMKVGGKTATEKVLVMAKTVGPYQTIQEGDLGYADVPEGAIPEGVITDPKAVIGKTARDTLFSGDPIRPERIYQDSFIKPGEKLIAVSTDLVRSVGGSVVPGDRVDVVWVSSASVPAQTIARSVRIVDLRSADGKAISRPTSQSQPVGMLASMQQAGQEAMAQNIAPNAPKAGQSVPAAVVLHVREAEALTLARAMAGGQLILIKTHDNASDVVSEPVSPAVNLPAPSAVTPIQSNPPNAPEVEADTDDAEADAGETAVASTPPPTNE